MSQNQPYSTNLSVVQIELSSRPPQNNNIPKQTWIRFGDHPLNLERYRLYYHGPCARMTHTHIEKCKHTKTNMQWQRAAANVSARASARARASQAQEQAQTQAKRSTSTAEDSAHKLRDRKMALNWGEQPPRRDLFKFMLEI